MKSKLLRASRRLADIAVLSLAFWLASLARFDGDIPLQWFKQLAFAWPYVVGVQYFFLMAFNVPRFQWRYVGLPEAKTIGTATALASSIVVLVRLLGAELYPDLPHALYAIIPFGVIVFDFALAFLGLTGMRVLRRMLAERSLEPRIRTRELVPTLLIGAGQGGVAVAKEVRSRPSLGIAAVGFLDDDPEKAGAVIHGIPVLGNTSRLAEHAARHGAKQVLVTIAQVSGKAVRRIVDQCEAAGLPVKTIPSLHEIVSGHLGLTRIRAVAIEDLLRREPVSLDDPGIASFIQGKTVMVTGAGGSIGSEICRQVARYSPRALVMVERFESALFEIHSELNARIRDVELVPEVADVREISRMEQVFSSAGHVEVIFHAAAHKHVPMMEANPGEAIRNNVLGTKALADLAAERDAGHFVMVSTDKAVNPTSVMGATKRVAELYVQGMHQRSTTRFVSVRFGNVLGSNGSVIPIFKRQIAAGGPVTVTHPEMTRYFMTIPEATQLVMQAATLGSGGEVFILDMGEPVKIVDLARDLIRLSGFEADRDIEIEFTGIRPGEKLFEELTTDGEHADATKHGKVFVAHVQGAEWDALNAGINALGARATSGHHDALYEGLRDLIPEFSGQATPAPSGADIIPLARKS